VSPRQDPGERLRRLLAVIPWLAARGTATFEEIAERFGMDVAAVEDELLLAACCGLPPYSPDQLIELVVDEGGVTANVPDYFRRPLKLSAADGFAILAAGRALLAAGGSGALEDAADAAGPLATALEKLAGVLGGSRGVTIDLDAPPYLAELRDAAEAGEKVEVEHYSASRDEVGSRVVGPLAVFAERGRWYMDAFDWRPGQVLHFRVDRVRSVRRTGERFDADVVLAAAGGRAVGTGVFRPGPDMPEVTLRLPPGARWVVETYPTTGYDVLDDGSLRVRLAVSGRPWLERLLLRVGPEGGVESPEDFVGVGAEVARRLLERYRQVAGAEVRRS
jgi:proteasome accessory factor C